MTLKEYEANRANMTPDQEANNIRLVLAESDDLSQLDTRRLQRRFNSINPGRVRGRMRFNFKHNYSRVRKDIDNIIQSIVSLDE